MITSFTFHGDFEDPHGEFFVRKLYRKEKPSEFIFHWAPENIPSFLVDTAQLIFKAGSSLKFLSRYYFETCLRPQNLALEFEI